ncbi:MAG: hypothetical protein J0I32_20225 [Sphingobacteriales bacterium]|nr:hypothetical protein [Sphingobacteriales bacterium]OJV98834.1 MAG: hypothetical protein BGO52_08690 [Sphingobacteriales bacterium 44-61]
MTSHHCILLSAILFAYSGLLAQSDTLSPSVNGKYFDAVNKKASQLEQRLDKQSAKIITQFLKQENKLKRKLARKDSAAATAVFGDAKQRYDQLQQKLAGAEKLKQYIPSLDTLSSSLKFLEQNPQLMALAKDGPAKLKEAMSKVNGLQSRFQQAEEIKKFIRERKQYLKEQLGKLGVAKELKQLNKQVYYYSVQVNEYKQLLNDHKKAEQKAIELLSQTKLFKDFMRNNSQLASLFRLPGSSASNATGAASLAGLQTRAQVNNLVQQQIAAGGPNAQAQFSQNMQQAQSQLNELKNKLNKFGNSGGEDLDMPDGFKPNGQRTKSFFRRIELGANIQSQQSNGYFPVTSDIALTAGYKLNDNSMIGVGASYKMGWGENIRNIKITHQGIGLRSFIEWKLKGSFWLAGGYELNYRSGFQRIAELRDRSGWQESGLIGLSKVVDLRSKILKKTKVQLLWDFLSYRQVPKPAAILFRIGYVWR